MGAEQLLGMGDMLYMAGGAKITRCHGPFVSDEEVEEIVNHLKAYGAPTMSLAWSKGPADDKESRYRRGAGPVTAAIPTAKTRSMTRPWQIVIKDRKCSTSYIQRKLAIGYNKAARLVEQMEEQGSSAPPTTSVSAIFWCRSRAAPRAYGVDVTGLSARGGLDNRPVPADIRWR